MALQCCEHNACPEVHRKRPRWRYRETPWRCPQCGKMWNTKARYSWADYDGLEWFMSYDPTAVERYVKES